MIRTTFTYTCDSCGDVIAISQDGGGPLDHRIHFGESPDLCGRCAALMLNHLVGRIEDVRIAESLTYTMRMASERKSA